jgi:hypothetical protein
MTCVNEKDYVRGQSFGSIVPVDENGRRVTRTKITHPYSYAGFVQERVLPQEEATATVYTDRLLEWDYDLTRKLQKEHFGNDGDYYDKRSAAKIQEFLRERLTRPTIEVVCVMEYCNQSTGYPTWRIDYK